MSSSANSLTLPHVRRELELHLSELQAKDPHHIWEQERQEGLLSGIDQVFHFFFDDHDFDDADVGAVFVNRDELAAIESLKLALEAVLDAVGDVGDDEFVGHSLWPDVTRAAASASRQLGAAG